MKYILLLSLFFVSSFSYSKETATEPMDAQALNELGEEYFNNALLNQEEQAAVENLQIAFALFEQSSRLGYAKAQSNLGFLYLVGYVAFAFRGLLGEDIINDPDRAEDIRQGLHWLDKAANQGDANIQYEVAELLYRSYQQNENLEYKKKALHWLQQSADQGNQDAIDLLSEINSVEK